MNKTKTNREYLQKELRYLQKRIEELEQTRKQGTETTELFKCAHVILQSTQLQRVIKRIVSSCKKITGATAGRFILLGENDDQEVLYSDIPDHDRTKDFDAFSDL